MTPNSKYKLKRQSFANIKSIIDMPDLLDVQVRSFKQFTQEDIKEDKRELIGLEQVFRNAFPIEDNHKNYILEYKNYYLGLPKYSPDECIERGVTYSVPLKVRLILHLTDEYDKSKYAQSIEQDVYFGNLPHMTERGTFIINGAERVIVNQLQRSPGVFFDEHIHPNGTKLFQARVIPSRGSWVDFTTDIADCIFVIIDRRRKFPVTTLLRALGFSSNADIFRAFNLIKNVNIKSKAAEKFIGARVANDVIDVETGEIFCEDGAEVTVELLEELKKTSTKTIEVARVNDELAAEIFANTMKKDPTKNMEEALRLMYKHIRSGEPPNLETAQKFIERMFFSPKRYDLGKVGRYRINKQFDLNVPLDNTILTTDDLTMIIQYLIEMRMGKRGPDDIDHLGNRRMKTVCEQLTNQFMIAMTRMIRNVRERMNLREVESLTPQDLINSRVVTTVINTFFGTSQLSQFMDQTNPLAEITHKRRVSALGPGGLTRERAGFEVRDVHYTHYSRLCPIETPEGPNIGLISSLAMFADVNDLGFIEAPYRVIKHQNDKDAFVTREIKYLSAEDEDRSVIAQPNIAVDEKGKIVESQVRARIKGDFPIVNPEEIQYMDVVPQQVLSVAASLIPFLEHDDANRALMGSNMQRQAVPLLNPEAPIVGTGMEKVIVHDSRGTIYSQVEGVVQSVDAQKIVIRSDNIPDDITTHEENLIYISLKKYRRSNQDTCIDQRPVVSEGQKVKIGDLLADGTAVKNGELALGRNLTVAFMPWWGYNFEDAIVVNERLVKDDIFTSVTVSEIELEVRDTKRGEEELTSEIPNVSEENTKDLDENGVIRVGARVKPGDIIVGKVTPKGETDPTPEEKLLRAIFGEKAGDVKDASKKAEHGIDGVVTRTRLFERKRKGSRVQERKIIAQLQEDVKKAKKQLKRKRDKRLKQLMENQTSAGLRDKATSKTIIKASTNLTKKRLKALDYERIKREKPWVVDRNVWVQIEGVWNSFNREWKRVEDNLEREIYKLQVGDELQPGVLKLAKVNIASKRKLQVGDKMAGRHGNKGVVSVVIPEEDMPFLANGTPVDIVLNPLGVPSRMNLGQLYETMLGWAGEKLGVSYETPAFDGATPIQVEEELKKANIPQGSKVELYDGKTGEKFDYPVTVGKIYMMKLNHMVDDKMHARSTGPYSLITQQPLGGKAQFGGQRFGEMEVWALEAYGASNALREILTVKSDDVEGRSKVYNAIVRGENIPTFGVPESFNVLVKELQGLGVNVELH